MIIISCGSKEEESSLYVFATTDVHGAIFNNDPLTGAETYSSMTRVASYMDRFKHDDYILLDNGDNLQGSPAVYYYNFEDTTSEHIWSRIINYLGYDAVTVGNHDIEAGHGVYDRIRREINSPMLAANAVSAETGKPYFEPYVILERKGLKVAVMGLITPGVPGWLPEVLYEGIEFRDMVETAEKWMPEIKSKNPDLVIGLFHAGWDETYEGTPGSYLNNNASLSVASEVTGFDIIMIGHDHDSYNDYIVNGSGDSVLILDGGSRAAYIEAAEVKLKGSRKKKVVGISGDLVKVNDFETDSVFTGHFYDDFLLIKDYISREIGTIDKTISTRDAYFGDSGFMDLIHKVQLAISQVDISFAAPLSYDVTLDKGTITVSDMFDLYRYENFLYTIEMSGEEIDRYLEYSYAGWFSTMEGPDDNMFETTTDDRGYRFSNRTYNFDSAAGIDYIVDISKPDGDKVEILSLNDGRVFENGMMYRVAVNSYRGSGGGGHLAYACSLNNEDLKTRLLKSTDKDLRYYMIKWFEENDNIIITTDDNWHLVPEEWVSVAAGSEYKKLFENKR